MPPKGYQSLGEDLITVATRLPESMLQAVDAHIAVLHTQAPWARVNRADALRDLVQRGLQQASGGGTVADVPSTGPALLGMEQTAFAPALSDVSTQKEPLITPLQQMALTSPPAPAVEAAAAVPVPELENSVDLGTPGAGEDEAATQLAQLRERSRRASAAYRERKRGKKAAASKARNAGG
jgi:hypothetical protein